ncbi:MAG: acyl-CoA thioesterase [Deltaproteobacteria bacterium]|nr:acyl-CoA thioesterase [Deltaproteobacteria bacterium]MBW2082266.1 acyl-CoA thioesterase [Deltaproteobacteria bacterium]
MKKHPKFCTTIAVRFSDTDANGHVFFGNYLTYFDTALLEYLKAVKYSFERLLARGLNMYYVEALARFKGASLYGDTLDVYVKISRLGNTSFTAEFHTYKHDTDQLINSGHIIAVLVDVKTEKPSKIPEDFRTAISEFQG